MTISSPRRRGLTLIEVLVTLLLVAVAFGLVAGIFSSFGDFERQQNSLQRFLVDCAGLEQVVTQDLGCAYAVVGTSGSDILVVHRVPSSYEKRTGPSFNSVPTQPIYADYTTPPTPKRGTAMIVTYKLNGDRLWRDVDSPARSEVLLEGLSDAVATLNGSRVDLRLSLQSDTKIHVYEAKIFCPGIVP